MKKIDLHIHTNLSDGVLSPKEVIDEAKKNNVDIIAIADHDSIEAYNNDLYNYAKNKNIKIINAVEISTKINKIGIHILGYNFDINNINLKNKLLKLRNARHDYLYNVANKLNLLGYYLNIEKLNKIECITKAHIALDVINNVNNQNILLKTFNHIPTKGEFIENIMNEGCPAYVEKETISPLEASILIKNAGGKVVLAHPVAYEYEDNLSTQDILNIVKNINADGIEAYYIYIDSNNQKINDINKWKRIAKEHNLITTIGSDFHKNDIIYPSIGLNNENLYLDDDDLQEIISNLI